MPPFHIRLTFIALTTVSNIMFNNTYAVFFTSWRMTYERELRDERIGWKLLLTMPP